MLNHYNVQQAPDMNRLCVYMFVTLFVVSGNRAQSTEEKTVKNKQNLDVYSYSDVLNWWYGANITNSAVTASNIETTNQPINVYGFSLKSRKKSDSAMSSFIDVSGAENVEFEDVLNNIVNDYFENKTTLSNQTVDLIDNNYDKKDTSNVTVKLNDTEKDPFYYIINAIEGNDLVESTSQSSTGIIIDLLNTGNENGLSNFSTSSESPNIVDTFTADNINVMKREIPILSIDNELNETDVEVVTEAATNDTDALEQLKEILIPLNNIIKHKQEEAEELKFIKEKLINFIKTHTEKDFNLNLDIKKMMDVFTLLDFSGTTTPNTTFLDFIVGRFEDFKNASSFDDIIQNFNKCLENTSSTEKYLTPLLKENDNIDMAKNKSTFKKVINLIRETKNDILAIIRAKISEYQRFREHNKKSEIEKNKKDLTEFEEVIRKWQESLNVLPNRNKRSALNFKDTKSRMKNILPKYLRGKVKPESKQSKKHRAGAVRTEKKHGSKNKDNKHKRRTSKAAIKNTRISN